MIKTPTLLSLSITGVNIFARLFHLLVFLLIGNLYGMGHTTDLVFLVYAPFAVIMSVTAGAAEVIIMPGVRVPAQIITHSNTATIVINLQGRHIY